MSVIRPIEDARLVAHRMQNETTELRQLRHQTRNALQRIIIELSEAPCLSRSREGRRVADELIRRIELSVAVSDALFGFTQTPLAFPGRVRSLAESLIALHSDGTQSIELEVTIAAGFKASFRREELILRLVHELVVNALQHGMQLRLVGKLAIRLDHQEDGGLMLSVTNDGWQMDERAAPRGGLGIIQDLIYGEDGSMRIITQPLTSFQISLPPESKNHAAPDLASAMAHLPPHINR